MQFENETSFVNAETAHQTNVAGLIRDEDLSLFQLNRLNSPKVKILGLVKTPQ